MELDLLLYATSIAKHAKRDVRETLQDSAQRAREAFEMAERRLTL